MPPMQPFVRGEMLPSGYLIRPCEGSGSIIHIVDHIDFESWSVPEVVRPLYESSAVLAQKTTMAALRQLRQIAHEISHAAVTGWGRGPVALRQLSHRLSRGFNEAINGFADDGWSLLSNDSSDDVTIHVNSSPTKMMGLNVGFMNGFPFINSAVICAKASMLLQNVSPALLVRFLREHRSEWADSNIDAYSAASIRAVPCTLPGPNLGGFRGQVILPLAQSLDHDEFLEVLKLENMGHVHDDYMPKDLFLLQLCSGVDENAVGACSDLVFTPIDASFADDCLLLPSGFRIFPLDLAMEMASINRTLDLASVLEAGSTGGRISGNLTRKCGSLRSVLTVAFQFVFERNIQENVAEMARQYICNIISSVQRVALALSPACLGSRASLRPLPSSPEAVTLTRWICHSYRCYAGEELLKTTISGSDSLMKILWHHSDGIICRSLKAMPVFTFANQAGLDMFETTLGALQDITLEKIFDEHGRKALLAEFPHIMQQGFACLHGGICVSSMGRPVSYEKAVAWKVLNDEEEPHCICFMFVNWSFV